MKAIKAIVVDDSAVVRKHLTDLLVAGGIDVIASASDPLFAWNKMHANWPDVVVLDVEMPRMDGITFLKRIMSERPTPVVMCSTLTEKGCETTMQALAAGAVSFITKPKLGLKAFLEDETNGIVAAVRAASRANLGAMMKTQPAATARPVGAGGVTVGTGAALARPMATGGFSSALSETTDRVIALGLSTGGVQSIEVLLTRLPRTAPGIVVVQHMPPNFTAGFAARLSKLCTLDVVEAKSGDRVVNGRVLIAPGGRHMRLKRSGAQYIVEVFDGPLMNHHRPSIDVLFKSVAQHAGRNAIGVVMTGMGDDGARGLKAMRDAGAITAAQDEASSVVYGMPREAVKLGAAQDVVSLHELPDWLMRSSQAALRQAA
jgi:two-component system chemotaxis response regulator CheB